MLAYAGIVVLGIVLLLVGWFIQPNSNVTRAGTQIVDNAGVAFIAVGLTLLVAGLGFFFAWAAERAIAEGMI